MSFELRPYQLHAVQGLRNALRAMRRVILSSPTGSGKCLGRGTPVLMVDGTTREVQDILPRDILMGPDGKGRAVLSVTSGIDDLYRVTPVKGDPYVVNSVHLLSLVKTQGCDGLRLPGGARIPSDAKGPVFVQARDFSEANKTAQHCLKGWRPGAVDFEEEVQEHPIPPYILGVWLGDGSTGHPAISKPIGAVTEAFSEFAMASGCDVSIYDAPGKCPMLRMTNRGRKTLDGKRDRSSFHRNLASLGVLDDKHIPQSYLMTTQEHRLELLAGLLDTDGYMQAGGFDFIQKSEQIARAVVFLCRSLGLAAYTHPEVKGIASTGFKGDYWRVSISGDCSIIPCRDPKKRAPQRRQKKNHLVTGITVEPIGRGAYFGFELDGDKQFLLGDWQVTHNTEMGFEVIRSSQEKGKKVAFIANRVHLVEQTCRRLAAAGFAYGVIQGENTIMPWASILVCSIQTLAKRGLPEGVDLIIVDEAHACAGTEAYHELFAKAGVPVIGLTATPYSKGLGKHYDDLGGPLFEGIVTAARIEDLIRDGFLVSADVWAPSEPDLTGVKITAGDYNEKDLGEAVDKVQLIGDIVKHWFRIADDTPTVCFATNISHSKHIVEQFQKSGVAAAHVDCYTSDEDRQEILRLVAAGDIRIISNVGILAEGWDFPACKTLILARPTKSLIRYLQMAGRVLRPYPGKEKAIILDHSGTVRRLGFPWGYFGQHLDDGKPKRSAPEKPKEEPLPKACPHCSYMKPPRTPVCPSCHFESRMPNEVETKDGELVPMTKGTQGIKGLEELTRTAVYQQLLWVGRQKGYKETWASCKYRSAFGCWPNGIAKTPAPPEGVLLSWLRSEQIKWAKQREKELAQRGVA